MVKKIKKFLASDQAALIAILLPIVLLAALILLRAVNIVFWDEWEQTSIFQHIHSGHLYFNDFWQQHNEHRLFFPTILLVLIDYATRWNVIVECLVSFLIAIASFWLLLRMLKTTAPKSKRSPIVLLLLGMVWFSPVQVENWLWGWQLEWFLSVLGVMLVAFGLSRIKGRVMSNASLLIFLAGGILAQYSLGNGTLVWPIGIFFLIYRRLPVKQLAVAAATALVTTLLYYRHYVTPVGAPSRGLATHEPVGFAKFVLLYLGRPLSYLHDPAMVLGLLLVASFVCLSVYLLIRERARFNLGIPWIFLGLYAVASSLVTGLARLGFGVDEAATSRYTTISLLLLVSTIVLYWQNKAVFQKLLTKAVYRPVAGVIALAVFACVSANIYWGAHAFNTQYVLFTSIKTCTHQTSPSDACLLKTYPDPNLARTRLQYLKSIHWAGY